MSDQPFFILCPEAKSRSSPEARARLETLTYPSGDVLTYTVGGAGRATQLSDSSSNYVGYTGSPATYAPPGSLAGMTNGYTNSFAGIVTTNSYNNRLQPILLSASVASTAIFSLCFDFHLDAAISACNLKAYTTGDNGNIFQVLNGVNSNLSAAYAYDPLNRISQANTVNTASANCWGEAYTIDAWGNLTNRSGVSGMSGNCYTEWLSATATTQNQLGGIGMTYDAAGNVTNDGKGNQPTYDAENRMVSDAGVTYYYDADGARMEKSSGTKYWFGPGGEVLTEASLTGTINEEYFYFNGERIARVDRPSGTVHYYFSDHLGSASLITDVFGNTEEQTEYYPFGGVAYNSGNDPNHYKFTGKERDAESGLDNFGARYDASSIGRFMTPDPLLNSGRPGDPQTWNRYTYARNNPMNTLDPTGLYNLSANCGFDASDTACNRQAQNAKALKKGLANLQKKVNKMKDGIQKRRLEASLKAFGTENDGNNVTVSFGATKGGNAGETVPVNDPQTYKETYNVTLDPSKLNGSNEYAVAGAHEGTHIDDINTELANPTGTILSAFSLEYRGYQTSAYAASALGDSSYSANYDGNSYLIWNGSWGEVDKNVTHLVTNFHDKNGKPDHPETTPHNPWPN